MPGSKLCQGLGGGWGTSICVYGRGNCELITLLLLRARGVVPSCPSHMRAAEGGSGRSNGGLFQGATPLTPHAAPPRSWASGELARGWGAASAWSVLGRAAALPNPDDRRRETSRTRPMRRQSRGASTRYLVGRGECDMPPWAVGGGRPDAVPGQQPLSCPGAGAWVEGDGEGDGERTRTVVSCRISRLDGPSAGKCWSGSVLSIPW
jgi:hypothetical protein